MVVMLVVKHPIKDWDIEYYNSNCIIAKKRYLYGGVIMVKNSRPDSKRKIKEQPKVPDEQRRNKGSSTARHKN